ncbi:MAG: nitrilase-related carbon-nitrogen hydrolase, partial [Candidatus Zixiibacteriota bacterium]
IGEIRMIVALYQNNPEFGQIEKNIENLNETVKDKRFDLLVLPELFATGYQFKDKDEARLLADEAGQGATFKTIKKLAQNKRALIVYGFPEKNKDKLFNSAIAVKPDGSFYLYQKTHLFNTEKSIFEPGETGFIVFDFNGTKIGLMICFDWRFPESARRLALDGAQIICHPSNLVLPFCPDAMLTRALENNVFTITADRIGSENRTGKQLNFIGKSRIIAPNADILNELGSSETGYIEVEINPQLANDKQVTPSNNLFADRREEYY